MIYLKRFNNENSFENDEQHGELSDGNENADASWVCENIQYIDVSGNDAAASDCVENIWISSSSVLIRNDW